MTNKVTLKQPKFKQASLPAPMQEPDPILPQASQINEADGLTDGVDHQPPAAASFEAGAHIDALIGDTPEPVAAPPAGALDQEQFHAVFCAGFSAASLITGIKSLHVDEADGKARAATGALYETIQDIPALHFLLEPQGKWLGRAVAIGTFAIPMARGVAVELQERRTGAKQYQKRAGAAAAPDIGLVDVNMQPDRP